MKVFVFLFLVIGACSARSKLRSSSFGDEINSILDMVPLDKIQAILEHNKDNVQVLEERKYLLSDEFKSLWGKVMRDHSVKKLLDDLESEGVLVKQYISKLFKIANVPEPSIALARFSQEPGLISVAKKIFSVIPMESIAPRLFFLITTNPVAAEYLEQILGPEGSAVAKRISNMPEVKTLLGHLKDFGISVKDIENILRNIQDVFGLVS